MTGIEANGQPKDISIAALAAAPERLWELNPTQAYSIAAEDLHHIQLAGLRKRFEELSRSIPMVSRLAHEQGVEAISQIDDMAPMLFKHSVYKSYPLSFIEKNRFDQLTNWLDKLTAYDLSGVDTSGIETIDDWIDRLDRDTPVRIRHSSGTSGKLSFLPGGGEEYRRLRETWRFYFQGFGDEPDAPDAEADALEKARIIYPSYRSGAMAQHRRLDELICQVYGGDKNMVVALSRERMSADALSLGGRVAAAEARGELGQIALSPKLAARREEFQAARSRSAEDTERFFAELPGRYGGERVVLYGAAIQFFDFARKALERGIRNIFSPDSFVMMGGGGKGRDLPDNWREIICECFGVREVREGYGMTELVMATRSCPEGNYHLPPAVVPFLLDPQSGAVRPRNGEQSGRLGVFDLTPTAMWGGFLTGDAVTIRWGDASPCACGRKGAHILPSVRRYTEAEGGDDKITCAGAPEAHDKALSFIQESE